MQYLGFYDNGISKHHKIIKDNTDHGLRNNILKKTQTDLETLTESSSASSLINFGTIQCK